MIGSFLTRGLVMVFGYAYPAYECYKTVEKNRPEIEQLRFWCQYWILVAVLTVSERLGDTFISWVPMYSEAKLAFFIYLWYPKTRGTTYVYDSFFKPYVAKHENEIDRNILELRTRAGDMAVLYWQRAASYSQTRVFEILQYVASQSTTRPGTQQGVKARPPTRQPSARQPAAAQPENEEPPSPTSSTTSSPQFTDAAEEVVPQTREPTAPPAGLNPLKVFAATSITQKVPAGASTNLKANATPETSTQSVSSSKDEPMPQIDAAAAPPSTNGTAKSPTKETNMDEAIRVTRGRLRKSRSGPKS